MKTCPALPAPKNGHMVCTTDDFRYPTVCRFTCQAGYQLLGSRKRSCLAIAFWTGIAARCRGQSHYQVLRSFILPGVEVSHTTRCLGHSDYQVLRSVALPGVEACRITRCCGHSDHQVLRSPSLPGVEVSQDTRYSGHSHYQVLRSDYQVTHTTMCSDHSDYQG